jgi:hypothetical protein
MIRTTHFLNDQGNGRIPCQPCPEVEKIVHLAMTKRPQLSRIGGTLSTEQPATAALLRPPWCPVATPKLLLTIRVLRPKKIPALAARRQRMPP